MLMRMVRAFTMRSLPLLSLKRKKSPENRLASITKTRNSTRMRIRFAPRLVPTLAAFAMIALTLWLGRWQGGRAEEKAALQAMYEARIREAPLVLGGSSPPDALLYRRVRVAGTWVPEGQIFVDNRILDGRAGFHVITPIRVADGAKVVLVNRGWVARNAAYPSAPAVATPSG